ncbi:hypothetical protein MKEN_01385400 [Mycena kentingensis (nom. inval.)]|nr:hypothetical protein MKEN_01385400 [Mycena kentingensis (nom. inval.)]
MFSSSVPTAFISGPLEPTSAFFSTHYTPRIAHAVAAGHSFVLGPSRGTDALALTHLLESGVSPQRITVFLRESESKQRWAGRFRAQGVRIVVSGKTHMERDAAMTAASDYDILWYLTETEARVLYGDQYRPRVSGTEKNEIRRRELAARADISKIDG